MQPDAGTEAAILEVLDEYLAQPDEAATRDAWVDDPDALALGTAADEVIAGVDEIWHHAARVRSEPITFSLTRRWVRVSVHGDVAWLAAGLRVSWADRNGTRDEPMRMTAVLVCDEGRWRFAQTHHSMPDVRISPGQAFPSTVETIASSVAAQRPEIAWQPAHEGSVTLLFCDIENSTVLNEQLGDAGWVALLAQHDAAVRRSVVEHGGVEVKHLGDGFMLAFPVPDDALRCAVAMQRHLLEGVHDAEHPEVRHRIGLHTGDPVRTGADFFGRDVTLASRIASEAAGGEILVSALLVDALDDVEGFEFSQREPMKLKGFTGEHVTYAVGWR
jgi:adenylate cyclase